MPSGRRAGCHVAQGDRKASIHLGNHGWNDHTSAAIERVPGTSRYAYLVQDTLRVVEFDDPRFAVPTEPAPPAARIEVEIFPNPTSRYAHLTVRGEAEQVVIEVFDTLGRRVRHFAPAGPLAGESTRRLDLAGVSAGVYVVRVVTDADALARRISLVR